MKAYPITVLCRVMRVSRSGFYDYLDRFTRDAGERPSASAVEARAQTIFNQSRGSYGSRRIMHKLQAEGHRVGRYRVRSLMHRLGLKARVPRRYKLTTTVVTSSPWRRI